MNKAILCLLLIFFPIRKACSQNVSQFQYRAFANQPYCKTIYSPIICTHLNMAREFMRGNYKAWINTAKKSDLRKYLKHDINLYTILSNSNSRLGDNHDKFSMALNLSEGTPDVVANIGGVLFRVTLDTGATDTSLGLTAKTFKKLSLGINGVIKDKSTTIGGQFNIYDGLVKYIRIKSFIIDNASVSFIFFDELKDDKSFTSVIGMSVFNFLKVLSFDFPRKQVVFNDEKIAKTSCDPLYAQIITARLAGLTVHPKINGVPVTALIDTGANSYTILSSRLVAKLHLKATSSRFLQTSRGVSTLKNVGNISLNAFRQQFTLQAETTADSLPHGVDAIFTATTFRSGKLSLDFQNGLACFVQEAQPNQTAQR